ncbi:HD domain-containing protein [Cohnella yongneupensis]|uniref:HD domain-containing protein n=1 Tax=Cohnella yongneupensis TaxID=425006 RepID=A0ABW0QV58_9BACL
MTFTDGKWTAEQKRIIDAAAKWVRAKLERESSGHDWWHIERVVRTVRTIAQAERADSFVCELAALLHDMADEKLNDDPKAAEQELEQWLANCGVSEADAVHILEIIGTMSFKGGARPPMRTTEGKVVQDADRLDAIGAVGISRVFAYSGAKGRPIHDPELPPRQNMTQEDYRGGRDTAINHFYEKLLKLKDLMNTSMGKELAAERHRFMETYLEQFYAEWDGRK